MTSAATLAQPLLGSGHAHEENGGHGHSHAHDEEHGHGHGHGHGHDQEKGNGHGSTHGHAHDHEHGHKEESGHGHCDSSSDEGTPEDMHAKDKRKLRFAVYCALFFMLVELIGGMIANSLAIMADAAHMLSDVGGFAVSILALSFSEKIPDLDYSYGYKQVEVFGACISMMVVWGLSFVLLSEAIPRFIHPQHVDAPMMCVVSIIGFIVNVVLMKVLGHDHGGEDHHGHGHGHSHGHGHGHGGHGDRDDSTALQAAVAHVIGDIVMSLGVLFAAVVMWVRPFDDYIGETEDGVSRWNYMDPLCTVFFSILVLWTTVPTLMRALRILMGGAPRNVNIEELRTQLTTIPNVIQIHDLHVWSFGSKEVLCTAHLVVSGRDNADAALKCAIKIAEKYKAFHSTFQIELEGEFDAGSQSPLKTMTSDCYCTARGR